MPQRWWTCLDATCETEDGAQRAFIRKVDAENHLSRTGHAYKEERPIDDE